MSDPAQLWSDAVVEHVRALEAAAVQSDWTGADRVMRELAASLARMPTDARLRSHELFRHAFECIGRVTAAAEAARAPLAAEIKQHRAGRRAVAAYR